MPKVFRGKVIIPVDKINEYIEFMEEAEKQGKPFVDECDRMLDGFYDYLKKDKGYSDETIDRHVFIIEMFMEFLAKYTDVWEFSEITTGIAGSYFRDWYRRKVWGGPTVDRIPISMKEFFTFLSIKKNIHNEKVLGKR